MGYGAQQPQPPVGIIGTQFLLTHPQLRGPLMLTYGCWYFSDEAAAPAPRRLRSRITVRLNGASLTWTGDFSMMLPIDKQLLGCTVSYVDAAGNVAVVDGAPTWETDRPDLLTLIAAADGLSCDVVPVGPLGNAQITVTADADLGGGVQQLVTLGTIECVAGDATIGVINFPEPTDPVAP